MKGVMRVAGRSDGLRPNARKPRSDQYVSRPYSPASSAASARWKYSMASRTRASSVRAV